MNMKVNVFFVTVLKCLIKKQESVTAKRTLRKQLMEHAFHVLLSPPLERMVANAFLTTLCKEINAKNAVKKLITRAARMRTTIPINQGCSSYQK